MGQAWGRWLSCGAFGAAALVGQAVLAHAPNPKPTADYPQYAVPRLEGVNRPGLPAVTSRICVDQIGYLPGAAKFAVISDPVRGYNAGDSYTPGASLEVRRVSDGQVVLRGAPRVWNDGAVDEDSGDKGWWFDFSVLREPGDYYVFDTTTKLRSPVFRIAEDVYYPILRAACRVYYFQRENMPLTAEHTEGPWTDGAIYTQDKEARAVWAKDDASLRRDMAGGWMDAGDTDKYPTFMAEVIHPLLYAYQANPQAFGDDYNIPESGNGLPDILDEVKFELEWLEKMQDTDGGVFVKLGNIDYSGTWPLENDVRPRYYGAKNSAATLWTAGEFAHAARVYRQFPQWKAFADELQARALQAWAWYQTHPRDYHPDNGEIKSGLANRNAGEHDRMEGFAAIHLFALTGDDKFQAVILKRVPESRQMKEPVWSSYEAASAEALLDYTRLAKADPGLRAKILDKLAQSVANVDVAPPPGRALYRDWMRDWSYHWGSCTQRAAFGYIAAQAAEYLNVPAAEKQRLRARAADMLHSFQGVNPLSCVMLTNMNRFGSELSLMCMFHARWGAGTSFSENPPPGYVVGGPNQQFTGKSDPGHDVDWIRQQPRGKTYAEFDNGYPQNSWEITEPAIYYQAAYIRLLAGFVHPPAGAK